MNNFAQRAATLLAGRQWRIGEALALLDHFITGGTGVGIGRHVAFSGSSLSVAS
jgi:hypothetical protein